jgi:hypothetical protein
MGLTPGSIYLRVLCAQDGYRLRESAAGTKVEGFHAVKISRAPARSSGMLGQDVILQDLTLLPFRLGCASRTR